MYQVQRIITDSSDATKTSLSANVSGASKITAVFKRSSHSAGSSTFKLQVRSVDDLGNASDWMDYKKSISNANNTNEQGETRVTTTTLSADGSDFVSMDTTDAFTEVRVYSTIATDGVNNAWIITQ